MGLLAIAAFCCYGFMASLEPGPFLGIRNHLCGCRCFLRGGRGMGGQEVVSETGASYPDVLRATSTSQDYSACRLTLFRRTVNLEKELRSLWMTLD